MNCPHCGREMPVNVWVEIVKAKLPTYWYADRIGERFFVIGIEDDYYVLEDEGKCIGLADCKIVEGE